MIVIAGGTGFIGKNLARALREKGKDVTILSRNPKKGETRWTPSEDGPWTSIVDGAEAVIQLAGANVGDKAWTEARKREIHDSRTVSTEILAKAIARATNKPRAFLSASAIGYYGFREDGECTEETGSGDDFLARVCVDWEAAAEPARKHTRVVHPRIGVVLGEDGALAKMVAPFKAFALGPLGSGRQVVSWIHVRDVVRAFLFLLDKDDLDGPFNLVAPQPVSQSVMAHAISKALGRPSFVPTPAFAVRIVLGKERARIALEGQRVLPKRLTEAGFRFEFATIDEALADLL
jgi:hypothetical protein